jgi:hypothetical protein
MSAQNGVYDHGSLAHAIAALLRGEAVRIRCTDERERRRLQYTLRRYAARLGFVTETRSHEQFLIVRWNKPQC